MRNPEASRGVLRLEVPREEHVHPGSSRPGSAQHATAPRAVPEGHTLRLFHISDPHDRRQKQKPGTTETHV